MHLKDLTCDVTFDHFKCDSWISKNKDSYHDIEKTANCHQSVTVFSVISHSMDFDRCGLYETV